MEQFTDGWIPRRWPPCVEVIDDRVAEAYRRMTTAERLRRANELFFSMKRLVQSGIRDRNPGWNQEQVESEWRSQLGNGSG